METKSISGAQLDLAESDIAADTGARGKAYKWYFLVLLLLTYVVAMIDRSIISIIAEPLRAEFHLDDKQIGMLNAMFAAAACIAVLPTGWLLDRVNRRALLGIAVAAWSVFMGLAGFSANYLTLLATRMGVGAGEAPATPASLSLIADLFPIGKRNTAVGIYATGSTFGYLLVFLCGGWLLMHFDWRGVCILAGVPGLVLAALICFTTREPKRGTFDAKRQNAKDPAKIGTREAVRAILGNAPVCYAIGALTIGAGAGYSMVIWSASFLVRAHGLTVSGGAINTGLFLGICATVGSLTIGPIADRFSKGDQSKLALIPLCAGLLQFVGCFIMVFGGSTPVSMAGLALIGLTIGWYTSTGYSLVVSLAAPELRSTTMAAAKLTFTLLGDGPMPLITGAISDAVGGSNSIGIALLCVASLYFLSSFFYFRIHRLCGQNEKTAIAA